MTEYELEYHPVLADSDLPEGGRKKVEIGARQIGVYRYEGVVYALKNLCPHQGVDLHNGQLMNGCIVCPAHGWQFNLETGTCGHAGKIRVATYPVKIEDGQICVGLPA